MGPYPPTKMGPYPPADMGKWPVPFPIFFSYTVGFLRQVSADRKVADTCADSDSQKVLKVARKGT